MRGQKFALVFMIILLISITDVQAFWWLFRGAKQAEKIVAKDVERTEIKQTVSAQEVKTLTKQEQIQINRVTGNLLDDAFKAEWCKTKVCVRSVAEFNNVKHPGSSIYIIDDWEAKKYINNKFDPNFARRPDMLWVKTKAGSNYIEKITIYDTKTSAEAVTSADARGQGADYDNLCNTLNAKHRQRNFCNVRYVLPKEEAEELAETTDSSVLTCLVIGLLMIPDPTDLLCFVAG